MTILINPYIFGGGGVIITPIIWNSADKHADVTLSEADKLATVSVGSWRGVRSTTSFATGGGSDIEFEIEVVGFTHIMVGVSTSSATLANYLGADANGWGYYANDGTKWHNTGTGAPYGDSVPVGSKIQVKLTSGGDLSFSKDGVNQGTAFTGLSGTFYPHVSLVNTGTVPSARAT